jgi:hypothetical protein
MLYKDKNTRILLLFIKEPLHEISIYEYIFLLSKTTFKWKVQKYKQF